jgi:hypothetical protein
MRSSYREQWKLHVISGNELFLLWGEKNEEESDNKGVHYGALITKSMQMVPFLTSACNLSAYKSYSFAATNRTAKMRSDQKLKWASDS